MVLQKLQIDGCLKCKEFYSIASTQLHLFLDASTVGYGVAAHLRVCDVKGQIHSSFLMGKSRLAPIKQMTIPRLELTAATVAVGIGQVLKKELDMSIDNIVYHTDSTTVLYYI